MSTDAPSDEECAIPTKPKIIDTRPKKSVKISQKKLESTFRNISPAVLYYSRGSTPSNYDSYVSYCDQLHEKASLYNSLFIWFAVVSALLWVLFVITLGIDSVVSIVVVECMAVAVGFAAGNTVGLRWFLKAWKVVRAG